MPDIKDWEKEAGFAIIVQRKGAHIPLKGSVSFGITWCYKIDRDIDAGLKVLLDLFEKQGIVQNDRQFRRCNYMEIYEDKSDPRVEVEINEIV